MFLDLLILCCLLIHTSAYSSYNYPKKNYQDKKPSFGLDDEGNAVIEIPRKYWHGKNYHSLKIHLSKKVLQNLTHGWSAEHEHDEYYCKFFEKIKGRKIFIFCLKMTMKMFQKENTAKVAKKIQRKF